MPAVLAFVVLLGMYRRPEARPQAYLVSLLLAIGSVWQPDMLAIWLASNGLYVALRAADGRIYSASLMGLATTVLYAGLAYWKWPDSVLMSEAASAWLSTFYRTFCWLNQPLWLLVTNGVMTLLGLVVLSAHFRRYQTANVRVQTPLLMATTIWAIALLSVLFPTRSGMSLWMLFWLDTLFLTILYLSVYGFPKFHRRRQEYPSRRSYSRRSRRR